MYHHILVATDGSELAMRGLDHALSLARPLSARVTVVTATEPFPLHSTAAVEGWIAPIDAPQGFEAAQAEAAQKVLDAARQVVEKAGVPANFLHIPNARPADAVLAVAREKGCTMICMASHGRRGLQRLFLGSQTAEVLAESNVPVLITR